MGEVSDGAGELKEPDISSMLNVKARSNNHKRREV